MNNLGFYFDLGWHHIIAWGAFDHLLFVLALSAIYLIGNWKQVLILVTAFTIGHSVTLALSVYDLVRANDNWVEFLIPCTIAITAIFNLMQKDFNPRSLRLNYILALFFGLIHGLGFANAIRFMMAKDQSIGWSLFGFNIGLEAGQIVVVLLILLVSYGVVNKAGLNRKWWVWGLSIFALIMSLKMIWERFPSL
ncbi:MAG TPA: HupE/UreJ family protein [Ferruginibacter sp.]|nr:HupE/UreJ family protein [Chitinophagaceae bacterium]MBK9531115.1 HupE/UreJ family protein [Chitinophagaceae bacterium]HQW93023.1 HupE/UreJ family protein [Ferruginibacter sp.]